MSAICSGSQNDYDRLLNIRFCPSPSCLKKLASFVRVFSRCRPTSGGNVFKSLSKTTMFLLSFSAKLKNPAKVHSILRDVILSRLEAKILMSVGLRS